MNPTIAAVRALAVTRVAYGCGLLFAPRTVGSHWLGPHARHAASLPPARSLGVRDALVGVATLATLHDPALCSRVVALGAAGDTVDAVGTILARREDRHVTAYYAALAAAAAVASLTLSARLRDRSR